MDQSSNNLIPVIRVPPHHLTKHHYKDVSRSLGCIQLSIFDAPPFICLYIHFIAWLKSNLLALAADQDLHVLNIGEQPDTGSIHIHFIHIDSK